MRSVFQHPGHSRDRIEVDSERMRAELLISPWGSRSRESRLRDDDFVGSRRPRSCPHETSARAVELLLETKLAHPSWGPKKLLPYLQKRHRLKLPAPSTASNILAKHGLVQHNKRRHRHKHPGAHGIKAEAPNDLWTVDFKGQFKLKNGQWCYPLTIADQHSRYLLACDVKPDVKQHGVFPVFERLFKDHGLPKAIRSDNGAPFCSSTSIHGLSNLNVWWAKLGIEHSRMDPASPQQNGAHERMHRTLKAEVAKPPSASMRAQQRRFNAWRREYNEDRPHEFLDDDTPAEHYEDSPRPFPKKLPEPEYPAHFRTPTVSKGGNFRFKEKVFFISNTSPAHASDSKKLMTDFGMFTSTTYS